MRFSRIRGIIDRRILVNYRVDPDVLARLLPPPFRPKLIHRCGMAGICLIRLKNMRPSSLPRILGLSSENAAHRIAVEWDERGIRREGVFVPRRDTSSRIHARLAGTLVAGVQHHARFQVQERDGTYQVGLESDDRQVHLAVSGRIAQGWPRESIFRSLREASSFFEGGSLGYSPSTRPGELDAVELRCVGWRVEPLAIEHVQSSFFEDRTRFPAGCLELDCALLMRGIEHEWHDRREQPLLPSCGELATARAS